MLSDVPWWTRQGTSACLCGCAHWLSVCDFKNRSYLVGNVQDNSLHNHLSDYPNLHFTLRETYQQFEAVLQVHLSANRAMHEHFQQRLEVHDLTKKIFKQSVELMKAIQTRFLVEESYTDNGAWSAAQLLVTIDYNYLLKAMPAFPKDHDARHNLLVDLLEVALKK
jgi:hypothetical protein